MIRANNCLNLEGVSAKSIANELYDPTQLGIVTLPYFLQDSFRLRLRDELVNIWEGYVEQPLQVNSVYQDLSSYKLSQDDEKHIAERFPRILELRKDFISLWQNILREGGCREGGFNETEAVRYAFDSNGITYHRDRLKYKNLICVFVVEGEGKFYAAESGGGLDERQFEVSPGSLILMRAPRTGKKDFRPFHKVEAIVGERYVLGLRQKIVG